MCSPKLEVGPERLHTLFFRHVVLPILQQLAWGEALAYIPEVVAYEPHPLLRNAHLMTFLAAFWPRRLARLPWSTERLFEVEPGTRLLARCHWQRGPQRHPALVLVHGLEGSSESRYMLGIAELAFVAGFSVLRLNQRNCGGTEHLTPTIYNSGLSGDYRAILDEMLQRDAVPEVFFAGYSMGDRKSTRLNSSHGSISYAVFCLKKKKEHY